MAARAVSGEGGGKSGASAATPETEAVPPAPFLPHWSASIAGRDAEMPTARSRSSRIKSNKAAASARWKLQ